MATLQWVSNVSAALELARNSHVVLFCYDDWCPASSAAKAELLLWAARDHSAVACALLNIRGDWSVVAEFGSNAVPTYVLFFRGQLAVVTGARTQDALKQIVSEAMDAAAAL